MQKMAFRPSTVHLGILLLALGGQGCKSRMGLSQNKDLGDEVATAAVKNIVDERAMRKLFLSAFSLAEKYEVLAAKISAGALESQEMRALRASMGEQIQRDLAGYIQKYTKTAAAANGEVKYVEVQFLSDMFPDYLTGPEARKLSNELYTDVYKSLSSQMQKEEAAGSGAFVKFTAPQGVERALSTNGSTVTMFAANAGDDVDKKLISALAEPIEASIRKIMQKEMARRERTTLAKAAEDGLMPGFEKQVADEILESQVARKISFVDRYLYSNLSGRSKFVQLPQGLPASLVDGYQHILEFMNDSMRIFERLQEFERDVYAAADNLAKQNPTKYASRKDAVADARNQLIASLSQKHGFGETVALPSKSYSSDEWMDMLAEGHLFLDTTFNDAVRTGAGQVKGQHAEMTHVMQWYLIMKEMEANPEAYHSIKASDYFKELGDKATAKVLDWSETGVGNSQKGYHMWYPLFDSTELNFTCPEWFRARHDLFPDVGDWAFDPTGGPSWAQNEM